VALRWRWSEVEKEEEKMRGLLEWLFARVEKLVRLLEMRKEGRDEREGKDGWQGMVRGTVKEEVEMIREMSLIEIKKR
jgi:hypothetical protein